VLSGLLVIGAVVAITYFAYHKHVPFVPRHHIEAVFSNATQLKKGSPVRIAGVDVGEVAGVSRGPGHTAQVTMQISGNGLPVHRDATARIRPRLFLEGGFYVELHPGSPSVGDLDDGGTIPLRNTSVPVQFDQVLSALRHPERRELQALLDRLHRGLTGPGVAALRATLPLLAPTLRDGTYVAQAAQGVHAHDLSQTIQGLQRTTAALDRRPADLAGLITNLDRTTTALADRGRQLAASIPALDGVLEDTPAALAAVRRIQPRLRDFARAILPALRIAPPVLRRAAPLLDQARALVRPSELPALVHRLRPVTRALPGLERRLDALFPLVTPVTDCLAQRVVPVLNAKLDDGKLSTGDPAWLDLAHATVSLNSVAQDFDANGPMVRYLFQLGAQTISTGALPGIGTLLGSVSQPLLGVRPHWLGPGVSPPYRPDATCRDQPAPDLKAPGGPAEGSP
jgi:virulence factor Mce-like protein